MASRDRGNSSTDWDPMRDDYNDSTYDTHYPDNASTSGTQLFSLDHKKLYITSIPQGLNEQGLRSAFEQYGQIEHAFLSRDPHKRYGLVTYETAAEARIAMMKLNRTEPLNLAISLAHAKNDSSYTNGTRERVQKDNNSFTSSNRDKKPRQQDEPNDEGDQLDDSLSFDHNFHLELEKIKLEKLRVQEEKLECRQKMMLLQMQKRPNQAPTVSSSRRVLPDGRVIVQERVQEPDASITAGAGDSLNIPGLQKACEPSCIVCGARADMCCARCVITPYCSESCQRRDWCGRHSAVCHNLMRLNASVSAANTTAKEPTDANSNFSVPSPPPQLRRPRSPHSNRAPPLANRTPPQRNELPTNNNNLDIKTKFVPPNHHPTPQRAPRNMPRAPLNHKVADTEDEQWTTDNIPAQTQAQPMPPLMNKKFEAKPKSTYEVPQLKPEMSMAKETPRLKIEMPKLEVQAPKSRMAANFASDPKELKRPSEVTLVPARYLVEALPIGESFVISVEQPTSACASKLPGYVCLAMHAQYQDHFNLLLGDIFQGEQAIVPTPGTTFALLTDEGWYRARCLNSSQCALLDGSKITNIGQSQCRPLAANCKDIPEFCCVINGNVKVNTSLKCTILMKTVGGIKVSMEDQENDNYLGEGTVSRWLPDVEVPPSKPKESIQAQLHQPVLESNHQTHEKKPSVELKPQQTKARISQEISEPKPQPITPKIPQANPEPKSQQVTAKAPQKLPEVPRPDIINNGKYILLHVTSLNRACVRASDDETTAEFERVLQDAALYGMQKSKPLTEPAVPGQVVLCHYEEVHYRALVTRTKATENRYKVQYVEYGNEEIVTLDKLFTCPPELNLTSRPARACIVSLSTATHQLTPEATEYIDSLKEQAVLIATIPSGEKRAPSGSLIHLSLEKNKEKFSAKVEEMCTPEWKKLHDKGGDVVESDKILFPNLKPLLLPTTHPFVLEITDFSYLERGNVCGFQQGATQPAIVYGSLTERINEYCNSALCSEPYCPVVEELCLARMPPYPQWFRAVVVSHTAGAATATILYIDYGNMVDDVPIANLRKCMKEFAQEPAVAASADIKDWPKQISEEQLVKAIEFLQIDEEGRGKLPVKRCEHIEDDMAYIVEAPELIAAINSV